MILQLTNEDQNLAQGTYGPAAQMAMLILVQMAEIQDAAKLIPITQAHVDATVYVGDAGLEFAERLASLGAQVRVPTTLNVSGLDEHGWQEWAVPHEWAGKSQRQMVAYRSMGTIPTWTCAPYQTQHRPSFGEQIAWGESNAIAFANSVIGARTERYPDMLDICCALTGRVPAIGLHLSENRAGEVLMQLEDIPEIVQNDDTFYTLLGFLMGKIAGNRIPVVSGLVAKPSDDQLKATCATAASSGAVKMFHIVGVTPEAANIEEAFHGRTPELLLNVTMEMLRQAYGDLSTVEGEELDMVVLGSPHFSLDEFKKLLPLIKGKRAHPDVQFLISTNRAVAHLLDKAGVLAQIKEFGGQINVDTCILTSPMLPDSVKILMTNAGKFAYYSPGLLGRQVSFGSLSDCVLSAVEGRVTKVDRIWDV
jgi:predicted aconitase